jgi:hypothetical protein
MKAVWRLKGGGLGATLWVDLRLRTADFVMVFLIS